MYVIFCFVFLLGYHFSESFKFFFAGKIIHIIDGMMKKETDWMPNIKNFAASTKSLMIMD